jgi:hypothetical protein
MLFGAPGCGRARKRNGTLCTRELGPHQYNSWVGQSPDGIETETHASHDRKLRVIHDEPLYTLPAVGGMPCSERKRPRIWLLRTAFAATSPTIFGRPCNREALCPRGASCYARHTIAHCRWRDGVSEVTFVVPGVGSFFGALFAILVHHEFLFCRGYRGKASRGEGRNNVTRSWRTGVTTSQNLSCWVT